MNIDSDKLKQALEKQKFPEPKGFTEGVIERNYNRGINTAIKIIEFYEEDSNRIEEMHPAVPDNH